VRVLPKGTRAVVERARFTWPETFRALARLGDVEGAEMEKVFNLGVGMILVLAPAREAEGACAPARRGRDAVSPRAHRGARRSGRTRGPAELTRPAEPSVHDGPEWIGRDKALLSAIARLRLVAASELPVLVLGETGTGKELAARTVHAASERAGGPLGRAQLRRVARAPDRERALRRRARRLHRRARRARRTGRGGRGRTLFLDEIGDAGDALQMKLLRLLDTGEFGASARRGRAMRACASSPRRTGTSRVARRAGDSAPICGTVWPPSR
jgi:hypothetical protein